MDQAKLNLESWAVMRSFTMTTYVTEKDRCPARGRTEAFKDAVLHTTCKIWYWAGDARRLPRGSGGGGTES